MNALMRRRLYMAGAGLILSSRALGWSSFSFFDLVPQFFDTHDKLTVDAYSGLVSAVPPDMLRFKELIRVNSSNEHAHFDVEILDKQYWSDNDQRWLDQVLKEYGGRKRVILNLLTFV